MVMCSQQRLPLLTLLRFVFRMVVTTIKYFKTLTVMMVCFVSCSLGQQFATIEAITITSMLLQKFSFELVDPNTEPAYIPALTLPMTTGLPVRVKRRDMTSGEDQ